MKNETQNILKARLEEINCQHVQPWLRSRLMSIIRKEWEKIDAKALQKLKLVVKAKITEKRIGQEFLAGPPVDFSAEFPAEESEEAKGSKTEANTPADAKSGSNPDPSSQPE